MNKWLWGLLAFMLAAIIYFLKVMLGIYIDIEIMTNLKPCH